MLSSQRSPVCTAADDELNYKANLTKLTRINKAKHYNNYFLENKKEYFKNIGWNPRNYQHKQKVIHRGKLLTSQ